MHNKKRQNTILRRQCRIHQPGFALVKDIQCRSQSKKDCRSDQDHPDVHPQRLRRLLLGRRRNIPLHHILPRGIRRQICQHKGHKQNKARGRSLPDRKVPKTPTRGNPLPLLAHRRTNRPKTAIDLRHDQSKAQESSPYQNQSLNRICPNHRFNATHHGIDHAQHPDHRNRDEDVDIGHTRKSQCRQIKNNGHPPNVKEHEGDTPDHAGGDIKALFQILIGRCDIEPSIKRQVKHHHQWHNDQNGPLPDITIPIRGISGARNGHEGDGREHRRKDRQACDPKGNLLPASKIGIR